MLSYIHSLNYTGRFSEPIEGNRASTSSALDSAV
jgi:hypothetical protein